ncbi:DUF1467 family protein [Paraurantiacibacter namhicola]|nr:DUF1467 family protein [Paraurantiacibacter namhicola]
MEWTSIVAIYTLFWVVCAFILLPVGIRTADETGAEKVPGQADSAPTNFQPRKVVIRATVLAALLCGLYVANYAQGWVTVEDINFFPLPEDPA